MISGLVTAFLMLAFLGIAFWAYSARNRGRFADAAALPLTDEPPPAADAGHCGEACRCGERA